MQITFELGLIGIILVIGALIHLILRLNYAERTASLAAWVGAGFSFFIISLGSFPLRFTPLLAIGCVIWAALESHTKGEVYV